MICTLLVAITYLNQRLCPPPSSTPYTTYLPSGEMAATVDLPLVVNRSNFIASSGLSALGENLYTAKPSPAITSTSAIAATANNLRFDRAETSVVTGV